MPREGHDSAELNVLYINCYFNPRAPRGARPPVTCDCMPFRIVISIHVPREGHDHHRRQSMLTKMNFNPRAPRGARLLKHAAKFHNNQFQSTCPARGTTLGTAPIFLQLHISIHVPREGHDSKHAQFFRADLRKSYKYPAERDALPTKNVCKHIKTLG